LIGRLFPERRRRLRRAIIPLLFFLAFHGLSLALSWAGFSRAADVLRATSGLVEILVYINLAALAVFDLLLPLARIRYQNIFHEVALGGAYVIATIAFLRHQGLDFSGVIATSAVVTAVLAFSMQATLGNILGGVALQLDDSIRVGDWVQLDRLQGQIKEIRWRHTVIETRDWDTVIVPNSNLLAQNIQILGKREGKPTQHRMWVHFNVDFRYPPARVIQVVEDALRSAPIAAVATDPPPNCVCLDFAQTGRDSFAHYAVRYWLTDLAADDPTSSAVRVRVFAALKRANVPLALPAATLFVEAADEAAIARKTKKDQARRRRALDTVSLFAPLTTEERAGLAERLTFAPFSRGEVITREGQTAHWLYILHSGKVEVRVTGADGRQQAVSTLEAPNFFGEHGLMTGEPRSATVVALSEVECYRLDRAAFQEILTDRSAIAGQLSTILAERKLGLEQARAHLAAGANAGRLQDERSRILEKIQQFFGLDER
jgi:small-conductance mechanosensitive channel/CRP-like cAMP-binding protein